MIGYSSSIIWEHLIRDEVDYQRHVDYVRVNPWNMGL